MSNKKISTPSHKRHAPTADLLQIGNLTEGARRKNPQRRRLYDPRGISPCLNAGMGMGGNLQPFVLIEYE
jgi:hypothetical protein